jgi:hypothetical protein
MVHLRLIKNKYLSFPSCLCSSSTCFCRSLVALVVALAVKHSRICLRVSVLGTGSSLSSNSCSCASVYVSISAILCYVPFTKYYAQPKRLSSRFSVFSFPFFQNINIYIKGNKSKYIKGSLHYGKYQAKYNLI